MPELDLQPRIVPVPAQDGFDRLLIPNRSEYAKVVELLRSGGKSPGAKRAG